MRKNKIIRIFLSIIVLTIIFCNGTFAQDLIITDTGDSIPCKITKSTEKYIYFNFIKDNEIRKRVLRTQQINDLHYNYFPDEQIPTTDAKIRSDERFGMKLYAGGAYLLQEDEGSNSFETDYLNGLRLGYDWGIEANYVLPKYIYIALEYNQFSSSNSANNVIVTFNDGTTAVGTISDNIRIQYAGLGGGIRLEAYDNYFSMFVSMGYVHYRNKSEWIERKFITTGNTVGLKAGISYDIMLQPAIFMGINVSTFAATLVSVTLDDGTTSDKIKLSSDEYIDISNMGISLSFKFFF